MLMAKEFMINIYQKWFGFDFEIKNQTQKNQQNNNERKLHVLTCLFSVLFVTGELGNDPSMRFYLSSFSSLGMYLWLHLHLG